MNIPYELNLCQDKSKTCLIRSCETFPGCFIIDDRIIECKVTHTSTQREILISASGTQNLETTRFMDSSIVLFLDIQPKLHIGVLLICADGKFVYIDYF
jgi:hypothetical protein